MYVIRHGQSEFNVLHDRKGHDPNIPDAPLTPLGVTQAQKAARDLTGKGIRNVISSPYARAIQTANIIATELGATHHIDALAGERSLYSCDIGTVASKLRTRWPSLDFGALDPGQWWPDLNETMESLQCRVDAFREKWHELYTSEPIALVSHWYFIFALTGRNMANGQVFFRGNL